MFCGFSCQFQYHVAQITSAFFALLFTPASKTQNITSSLIFFFSHKEKPKYPYSLWKEKHLIGIESEAGFLFVLLLFFSPGGGGQIALFLGNFITFLYIMQSL